MLRVEPLLGRTFSEADDQPGSPGTVILSYGYWQRRFADAAAVLGETLVVDGAPHESSACCRGSLGSFSNRRRY